MRVGAALTLASLLAVFGIGLNTGAKPAKRKMGVAVRAHHPDASGPLKTGTKSTFSVDGVPRVVDEETVIYA
jgi:hypothetical protein